MTLNCNNYTKGFTIVELMYVVAIVSVLAAIAIPSYQNHLIKVRRADATASLLNVVAREERFFAQNGNYSSNLGTGGLELDAAANPAFITSERGYYQISLVAPCGGRPQSYCLTATAPATSTQRNDNQCGALSITNLGVQGISGAGNVQDCWK